jgi:hypothetical protein
MSAEIAQLFTVVDRRSDGSHRVSLVYNAASNPNLNPSSLLPCLSPLVPLLSSRYLISSSSLKFASPIPLPQIRRPCSHSPPQIHLQLPTSSPSPAPQ